MKVMSKYVWRYVSLGISLGMLGWMGCKQEASVTAFNEPTIQHPSTSPNCVTQQGWLIPRDQVIDVGTGKDGIVALEEPAFTNAEAATYLEDTDLIVGAVAGNQARAYPHKILDQHEIVNDAWNGLSLGVTFCYLTGTAIGWDRIINGVESTFGVSGLLYNSNLVVYDRSTDSRWAQMLMKSVQGPQVCADATQIPLVECTWGAWKRMYPQTLVLAVDTGFDRDYTQPALSSYITNESSPIFPYSPKDDRLPLYERVHGIIVGEQARVYQFDQFEPSRSLLEDEVGVFNLPVVVVGSQQEQWIVSFSRKLSDGTVLDFDLVQQEGSEILTDQEGNRWDILGYAVEGPRTGQRLSPTRSYMGYWFAWGAFYPQAEISGQLELGG